MSADLEQNHANREARAPSPSEPLLKILARLVFCFALFCLGCVLNAVVTGLACSFYEQKEVGPFMGTLAIASGSYLVLALGLWLKNFVWKGSGKRSDAQVAWYSFTGSVYLAGVFGVVVGLTWLWHKIF